jgi:hypothetical protein
LFPQITAQKPANNATLERAAEIVAALVDSKISKNPRVYAEVQGFGGCMLPAHPGQDRSDLPDWSTENWDGETTLDSMGVPFTLPVYLFIFVAEASPPSFCNVAQIDQLMRAQGKTLSQAVGVTPSTN